jgi:predicted nucleotidyltransferase
MKTIKEIKSVLAEKKTDFRKEYKVKEISIFGSYVKDEQKETSDIDILVTFDRPVSLLHIVSFENHLSDILGIKADVILEKNIRSELRDSILTEAVPV